MDPNQQPNSPQEETPSTPTPDASTETPVSSEVPSVTPVESVPVSEPTPETTSEPTPEVSQPEATPASDTPVSTPTDSASNLSSAEVTPASDPTAAPVVPVAASTSEPVVVSGNPGFAFGLTSLILSLLSLGLFGVIFGILGLRKSKKAGQGNGLAIAGLIIGGIEVVFGIIALIFILIALPSLKFSE